MKAKSEAFDRCDVQIISNTVKINVRRKGLIRTKSTQALIWRSLPGVAAAAICGGVLITDPAVAETHDPMAVTQRLADRAKVINVAMDGLAVADDWHYHVTRTLLSHYGGYSRFEDDIYRSENKALLNFGEDTGQMVADLRRNLARTRSVTADDQAQFDALLAGIEALGAAGLDVYALTNEGRIDEANTIYWQRADPAYRAVIGAAYTIRRNHSRAIGMEALKAR